MIRRSFLKLIGLLPALPWAAKAKAGKITTTFVHKPEVHAGGWIEFDRNKFTKAMVYRDGELIGEIAGEGLTMGDVLSVVAKCEVTHP